MIERTTLPAINACLNGLSALIVIAGLIAIKRGKVDLHKKLMITGFGVSAIFLVSYLSHHAMFGSTKFTATGWPRSVYFAILLSHTVLAIVNLPMILTTVYYGITDQISTHKKLARWTWPIWVYVSSTGVLVYLMLYQIFPSSQLGG